MTQSAVLCARACVCSPAVVSYLPQRRGQTRSARGLDQEALADLTFALKLAPTDQECLHQRGLIYYKLRNYRRAIVVRLPPPLLSLAAHIL
jgi:Flp pilus assembly protein TadD